MSGVIAWLLGSAAVVVLGAYLSDCHSRRIGLPILALGFASFFAAYPVVIAVSHGWSPM